MYRTRLVRSSFRPSKLSIIGISFLKAHQRRLHLAPPFLLDDYIPRYHLLSAVDTSKKRSTAYAHLRNCNLCPRLCGVNRYEKTGICLIGAETVKVNVRMALYFSMFLISDSPRLLRHILVKVRFEDPPSAVFNGSKQMVE